MPPPGPSPLTELAPEAMADRLWSDLDAVVTNPVADELNDLKADAIDLGSAVLANFPVELFRAAGARAPAGRPTSTPAGSPAPPARNG